MESKRCHLVFLTGPRAGDAVNFDAARITVGRASTCDLQFDPYRDLSVASHHAEILLDDGIFYIFDLGARTGTYVNGERIAEKHPLRNEDYIQFGKGGPEVIFRLGWAPEGKQELPPPPPPLAELKFLSGTDAGRIFVIRGDKPARIGRRSDLDVSLNPRGDMMVSGDHCSISYENGEFIVTDTSRNGTFVNGAPVRHRAYLRDGDVLTLGTGGPRARFRVLPPQRNYPNRSGQYPRLRDEEIPTSKVSRETLERHEREAKEALAKRARLSSITREQEVASRPQAELLGERTSSNPTTHEPGHDEPLVGSIARTSPQVPFRARPIWKHPLALLVFSVFVIVMTAVLLLAWLKVAHKQKSIPTGGLPDYAEQINKGADRASKSGKFTVRIPFGWNVFENNAMLSMESIDKVIAVDYVRDQRLSEETVRQILREKGTEPILAHRDTQGDKKITSLFGQGATKCWLALLHEHPKSVPGLALIEVEADVFKRIPNQVYALLGVEQFRLEPYSLPERGTASVASSPVATSQQQTASAQATPTREENAPTSPAMASITTSPIPQLEPQQIRPGTAAVAPTPSPLENATPPTTPVPRETTPPHATTGTTIIKSKTLRIALEVPQDWVPEVNDKEGVVVLRTPLGAELRLTLDRERLNIERITEAMVQDGWAVYYRNEQGSPLPSSNRRFYAVGLHRENSYVLLGLLPKPDGSTFVVYALREGNTLDECKEEIQRIVLQLASQTNK